MTRHTNETGICELHKTALVRKRVPVSYGLPAYDEAFEVGAKLFPNSYRRVLGGCFVDENSPRFSEKMVCRECRRAEKEWRKSRKSVS